MLMETNMIEIFELNHPALNALRVRTVAEAEAIAARNDISDFDPSKHLVRRVGTEVRKLDYARDVEGHCRPIKTLRRTHRWS